MSTKLTLFELWKDKEKELGRPLPIVEVASIIKVHRNTLTTYLDGTVKRPDLEVCDKLCKFFNCPPGPVPFIIYEPN